MRFSLFLYIYIIKQTGAVYHTAILLYVLIVFLIDRLRAARPATAAPVQP